MLDVAEAELVVEDEIAMLLVDELALAFDKEAEDVLAELDVAAAFGDFVVVAEAATETALLDCLVLPLPMPLLGAFGMVKSLLAIAWPNASSVASVASVYTSSPGTSPSFVYRRSGVA